MKIAGITAKDTYKEISSKVSDINGANTQIDILTRKKKTRCIARSKNPRTFNEIILLNSLLSFFNS